MKKTVLLSILLYSFMTCMSQNVTRKVNVWIDGTPTSFMVEKVDSITFTAEIEEEQQDNQTSACYLVFHNEIHQDATLASSMHSASPGIFCLITADNEKKAYTFKTNTGLSSTTKYNAVDEKLTKKLGLNNGLIVGFGTISQQFCAFDHECPKCFDTSKTPIVDYPLTMNAAGIATCENCKLTFDLNNKGVCTNGERSLIQYRCGTTGPMGTLSVGN